MPDDIERLVRQLISGDGEAVATILGRAQTDDTPVLLVAAALVADKPQPLLVRAAAAAGTTRERQLVGIAAAHLGADEDRFDALVRDHLADHPDSVLAAWMASRHGKGELAP